MRTDGPRLTMLSVAAQPRRILVGYDGSEASQRALDAAAELTGYGSTLAVVNVHEDDGNGAHMLEDARRRLRNRLVTATYLEAVGDPAAKLVEAAGELDADLVVVGRRNQGTLRRLVLGSVSARVVRWVSCDVLVVR